VEWGNILIYPCLQKVELDKNKPMVNLTAARAELIEVIMESTFQPIIQENGHAIYGTYKIKLKMRPKFN
jgi:hypothetical protein